MLVNLQGRRGLHNYFVWKLTLLKTNFCHLISNTVNYMPKNEDIKLRFGGEGTDYLNITSVQCSNNVLCAFNCIYIYVIVTKVLDYLQIISPTDCKMPQYYPFFLLKYNWYHMKKHLINSSCILISAIRNTQIFFLHFRIFPRSMFTLVLFRSTNVVITFIPELAVYLKKKLLL